MSRTTTSIGALCRSTVGKKAVMAVSGVALLLFVVAHMVGNLKVFLGPESMDGYGRWLRSIGSALLGNEGVLWVLRIGLVVMIVLHMTAAIQLARRARAARPESYRARRPVQGSYAARTMRWGGVIIVLFVVYHLLDLTVGVLNPHGVHGEIYRNVTADFQLWYVTLAYTVAVLALGLHIRHGIWSALQTLGVSSARVVQTAALGFAVFICVGYLSVPFAVFFGLVR
ncbi:succinate dehydrogenase cytochrome b subunit [Allokutzneria sp. A3M-2-11 16]|uniref:succinate dehydrogenase cytochrome b subunit n=1 Tax=Allokutzneria sp. A3M-2-11 16 TaxID=2962043 RepID=UPI0027E2A7F4|nr:succinate dehydrogenase cytochrome b subunit [Allokutzneria sp. A3M-2-11 16]